VTPAGPVSGDPVRAGPGFADLPSKNDDGDWLAVIEAAQGSANKLKYDVECGVFMLHGVLPLGVSFPYDFGFLPSTLGDDGDPLDVLVLMDEPVAPGTVVPCRLIGVIEARQRKERGKKWKRNDRLLAVAAKTHRYPAVRHLADIAPQVLDEIERFFVFYNAQKGVDFEPLARGEAAAAKALVSDGQRRYRAQGGGSSAR
jgi:inorganic pyrophosphatase